MTFPVGLQESPNTAQIEREHSEAEQRRQKLLIDRQQVDFELLGCWVGGCLVDKV